MAVPNIFGTATSAIPLSQLDTNFATPVTIGNTAVQLGNTVTSFGNVTLTNVTISSGNVTVSAGSNTAPSITTVGDTNTGIFFPAADTIAFTEGGVEAARFDASGNMGLGVTPSAWSSYKAIQFGAQGSIASASTATYFGNNWFTDGTNKYIQSGTAGLAGWEGNVFKWYQAASGTAGNTISFAQAMTLDVGGRLLVGLTSASSSTLNFEVGATAPIARINATGGGTPTLSLFSAGVFDWTVQGGTALKFGVDGSEKARIDSDGNFIALSSNATASHKLSKGGVTARFQFQAGESYPANFYEGSAYGFNVAATVLEISKNNATSRSINAGGTVNASGADYAEYMTKVGNFNIAKGDVVGIDANGKLTNVFADAVSFVVKSTDPSYVGGDTWGSVDVLGQRPNEDAAQEVKDTYEAALEAARQTVDRIAFSGQVPVNVTGATAGQYIVPVNNNGAIKGEAVNEADMTLANYMKAVGKVIAIEQDGRAKIIVKVA
jgi:hypothetical protein